MMLQVWCCGIVGKMWYVVCMSFVVRGGGGKVDLFRAEAGNDERARLSRAMTIDEAARIGTSSLGV